MVRVNIGITTGNKYLLRLFLIFGVAMSSYLSSYDFSRVAEDGNLTAN
jgi:hypothetical protein